MIRTFLLWILLPAAIATAANAPLVHPGLLHSRADLERMRQAVAGRKEPIFAGYQVFRAHPQSLADYKMAGPFEEIGRNPTVHFGEFDRDANAAYQSAVLWAITGDAAHAARAKEILNGWSATLKRVSGADAVLMAGLGPFKMINAAEIMRYTGAGWPEAEAERFGRMCIEAIYPSLKDFAPFANGNWDTAAIKTVMAIAVYTDDRAMFERALHYYVHGSGDGRLTHYIYENGQCQESGRDQAHTQLGLGHLGDAAQIAWNQGLDLYGYGDNRLLKGFEYTARYNLGETVPFEPDLDRTGKYAHTVISPRGPFRPVYEQIFHHYVNRAGLEAPYTQKAADRIRPEGAAQGADHPGFGTLLYGRDKGSPEASSSVPESPAGLVADVVGQAIRITWIRPRDAATFTVKRAEGAGGAPRVIRMNVRDAAFTDIGVKPGRLYSYEVSASNAKGTSSDSLPVRISAGLPSQWSELDLGGAMPAGSALFDGSVYTLEAGGSGIGGMGDRLHYVYSNAPGNMAITARFVPQVSSQLSQMGLMMRGSLAPNAAQVALLLAPSAAEGSVERPSWQVQLMVRASGGQMAEHAAASPPLGAPSVTWGRLIEPYWLRLERSGNVVTGSISPDGLHWTKIGQAKLDLPLKAFTGLAACSRLRDVTTSVMFDQVSVSRR